MKKATHGESLPSNDDRPSPHRVGGSMPGLPKYLTAKDIAESLQWSQDTIYRKADLFGGFRVAYLWRFPPDAIARYLQATGQKQARAGWQRR